MNHGAGARITQKGIAHNEHTFTSEDLARKSLEERFGHSFSEEEWRLYRSRLIEFVRLLRAWETTE